MLRAPKICLEVAIVKLKPHSRKALNVLLVAFIACLAYAWGWLSSHYSANKEIARALASYFYKIQGANQSVHTGEFCTSGAAEQFEDLRLRDGNPISVNRIDIYTHPYGLPAGVVVDVQRKKGRRIETLFFVAPHTLFDVQSKTP